MKTSLFIQRRFSVAGFIQRDFPVIRVLIMFCCAVSCTVCFAQQGEWTWMKGDSGDNPPGVFGTQGVPAASNKPPGLYEAISWTDNQHNFWVFGGVGPGLAGDLWKYDVATNYWTWMSGNATVNPAGVYGTQGIPSASNHPGARGYGGLGWVDSAGNLWMFGGWGYDALDQYGPLNDVWKYNIATNEWTWMKGGTLGYQLANYGTLQVSSPNNDPGNRYEFNAGWSDENNNLWLFGGESQQAFTINLSDVWKYDLSSNEWTWMQGASAAAGYQSAVYGTLGVASPTNTPGSRSIYCVSKDQNGKFWTFGGYYIFSNPAYNDTWMFDPVTLEWTWMAGSTIQNDAGNYVALCDTNSQLPASRYENRSNWTDACGNLWVFGGVNNNSGALTDLWVHNTSTGKWIWVNGSSQANVVPVYGTQGIAAPANVPGGRSGTLTFVDSIGNLWLFGGFNYIYGTKNDLWRFVPDSTCGGGNCSVNQQINFAANDTQVCEKYCVNFTDFSLNNPTAWQWSFAGGVPSSSVNQNPTNICYNLPGVYDVALTTISAGDTSTLTLHNYITVYATPPFPTIVQVGYTLTSSPASSYQWQFNSVDIPGSTNQSYSVTQSGYYTVVIGEGHGCVNSFTMYVLITGVNEADGGANIFISPNPSNGNFTVEGLNDLESDKLSMEVWNTLGQKVFSSAESESFGTGSAGVSIGHSRRRQIDLSNVAPGVYFIEIKTQKIFLKKKIIITY